MSWEVPELPGEIVFALVQKGSPVSEDTLICFCLSGLLSLFSLFVVCFLPLHPSPRIFLQSIYFVSSLLLVIPLGGSDYSAALLNEVPSPEREKCRTGAALAATAAGTGRAEDRLLCLPVLKKEKESALERARWEGSDGGAPCIARFEPAYVKKPRNCFSFFLCEGFP